MVPFLTECLADAPPLLSTYLAAPQLSLATSFFIAGSPLHGDDFAPDLLGLDRLGAGISEGAATLKSSTRSQEDKPPRMMMVALRREMRNKFIQCFTQ